MTDFRTRPLPLTEPVSIQLMKTQWLDKCSHEEMRAAFDVLLTHLRLVTAELQRVAGETCPQAIDASYAMHNVPSMAMRIKHSPMTCGRHDCEMCIPQRVD